MAVTIHKIPGIVVKECLIILSTAVFYAVRNDRIPKSRKQHQGRDCCHPDSEYVCVKNHEKITDEHPAEITSYIAKSICDFTDQRNFYIFVFTLHNSSCLLPFSIFPFTHVFSTAVFFIISLSYIMFMISRVFYFSCTLIITFIVVSRLSSMYWYAFR